ncbi:MAG: 5-(carboxyamino)imidazole ribonucleotide synthase [Pyrobaculum sp.]
MRIVVLGGGQLGLMLCWAAQRLRLDFLYVDVDDAPAAQCARRAVNPAAAIENSDVVTYEFENIDLALAELAYRHEKLRPPLEYLKLKKSRLAERQFFSQLGIPTVPWARAEGGAEALKLAERWGRAVVKIPAGGYDGKGIYQYPRERAAVEKLTGELLVEEYVDVKREFSILAVRDERGDVYFYPPAENFYVQGILVWNYAPVKAPPEAYEYVYKILEWGGYVGVLAVEFFETRDGRVLVNEIAPRVHNTGHWTLETDASQFENHIRAIVGLPIRRVKTMKPTAMVNILGRELRELPLRELEKVGKVYWYGKAEAKPRRKMGHVNVVGDTPEEVISMAMSILKMIYGRDFPKLVLKTVYIY